MQANKIFKERRSTVVKIAGEDYKIPNEYSVEEVERLLELEIKTKEIENEPVSDNDIEKAQQLQRFYKTIFDRLEIMLQHYQPDVTADDLRSKMTHTEALDVLGWFEKHRHFEASEDAKKKLN
jgi:hypothetical protein